MGMAIQVVEDFDHMTVARVFPQKTDRKGAWPPPTGSILVERDGQMLMSRHPGDALPLRLSDGHLVEPQLAGLAFDPGQAPARMEQMLSGYVSRQTLEGWGFQHTGSRLLITVKGADAASVRSRPFDFLAPDKAQDVRAATLVRATAARLKAAIEAAGVPVRRMTLQSKLQHPHQFQLNATLALLGSVAIISLALSIILIVNLVDSIMTGEQRAIGVMKAIGADSGQIARDYLTGMALLGLVSGLIAVPFAVSLGQTIAKGIAAFLNFNILTTTAPPAPYAAVLLIGVLTPVVVAALRVRSTTRLSVREALARPGLQRRSRLADLVGALAAPLPVIPRMAVRATLRRFRRALLTGVSLALGLVFFLTALNLRASLYGTVEEVQAAKPYDLVVSFRGRYPLGEMRSWIADFPNVKTTEFWSSTEASLALPNGEGTNPALVSAVPAHSVMIRPAMIAGRWLDAAQPDGVVVNQKLLADEPLVRLGGTYRLTVGDRSEPVRVIGVMKEFGGGAVYAPTALVDRLTGADGQVNLMYVTLADSSFSNENKLGRLIEESVNQSDWRLGAITTSRTLEVVIRAHLEVIAQLLLVIAAMMLAVGGFGLASSVSVSVVERRREIGVLKAVGGRSLPIAGLFAWEAVLIATIGWGVALAIAPSVSRALSDAFGTLIVQYPFAYRSDPLGAPIALGVAVLIALISAVLPIRAALRITPLSALRTA
jgi:ABC-type antimicrobial peptide transport system permease subunit